MSQQPSRSSTGPDSHRRRKLPPLFPQSAPQPAGPGPWAPHGRHWPDSGDASAATSGQASGPAASDQNRAEFLVQLAIDAYQQRKFEDATAYLQSALGLSPRLPLAHNLLGMVYRGLGRLTDAIHCYEQALQCDPSYVEAHNNLGVACEAAGDSQRAIAAYQAALRIKPEFAAAHNNLGNAWTKAGKPADAIEHLQAALRLQPTMAAAHNNLGLAQSHLQQITEAEQSFRRAIGLQPTFPEAYLNLGHVLRASGKLEAAIECYRLSLQQAPRYVNALVGLGNALYDRQDWTGALTQYEAALAIQPGSAEAYFGIGNVRSAQENDQEAATAWRRAIELRDNFAEAHNNLGSLYHRQGHAVLAEKELLNALRIKPDLLAAHNNLGNLYKEQDRMDLAASSYGQVLSRHTSKPLQSLRLSTLCPAVWSSTDQIAEYVARVEAEWNSLRGAYAYQELTDLLAVANEPPYNLQFLHTNIRSLKEAYAGIFRYTGPSFRSPPRSGRLKLGMLVTPHHEVAFLRLIWGALKRLNSDEFERTILCSRSGSFLLKAALRDDEARIVELPEQPHQILHTIREQHLDVLHYFEICTDTLNYFLPFFRLAPVQVTSWGIQVTSGIPQVDAYLSSSLVEAPEAQDHYSETLCRAATLLTYQTPVSRPENGKSREAFGFTADQHLYSCVQHLGKFHPDFDPLLGGILRADPRGVVVTTQDKHGYGAQRLKERFARTIPDVADRIVFLPRQPFEDYLSLSAACDVMLDPPHFGGVTTTYDSLSLDKPIVTWPSRLHRGRYTLGCYRRMGVLDCVASSADEYIRLAVRLGTDLEWREAVSDRIRRNKWRVFADHQSVTEHERLFLELVERSRSR